MDSRLRRGGAQICQNCYTMGTPPPPPKPLSSCFRPPHLMTTLLLLAGLLRAAAAATTISCYGDAGQPVDWFVTYKLPALPDSLKGLNYMYLDGNSGGWQEGAISIDSTQGAVGRTMNQLYQGNLSELAYLLYNDQPPLGNGGPDTTYRGHTKGVLLLNRDSGIWLVHSVPHFPPHANSSYNWPQTAQTYGQTLLCVTFTYSQFREIDLYSGWLTTALGSDLFVQFWPRTSKVLPSNCSGPFHVLNVLELAFPDSTMPPFSATHDHAKWCVALNSTWTCIGDLNRNYAEEHRGGGTLCSQMPALWKAFRPLVRKFEPCSSLTPEIRGH
ncbi:deoxyribonuclease-2-alpha isoform X3 [Vombatus ursinus]|uniref:deoxyribonuclease-2-alpha isoform X3 n=1 Tax=Vombatus ursinus TaxID=29139 RepID=UPI000FFD25BC|nr:deoxyribonuclease-2-alpha isoform X3 [Vombatus ursinus]